MSRFLLALSLSLYFISPACGQILFEEKPDLAFLDDTSYLRGISWVDVDDDNDLDVCISGIGGTFPDFVNVTGIFINQGNDVFENTGLIQSTQSNAMGHGWADIENDGDLDVFFGATWNQGGINELWVNEGGTVFTQVTNSGATPNTALPFEGTVSWADYDNDGFADLHIARWNDAPNKLFRNNGDGTFSEITTGSVATDAGWTSAGTWGDMDNDLDLDLYVAEYQIGSDPGTNILYENNGDGTFTPLAGAGAVVSDAQNTRTANWVDANNDGFLDLYAANQNSPDKLYLNNGDGSFSSQDIGGGMTSWSSNWGDFDNDGDQDLLTMGFWDTDSRIYRNDGDGNLSDATADFPNIFPLQTNGSNSNGVIFVDYDLDGWLDLHLTQPNTSPDLFFRNLGDGCGSWLEVELIGTVSNRAAIGVTVRALATINGNEVWQMRQVSAQTAKPGSNPLWLHFGFGDAEIIDSLVVEWPSGLVCEFSDFALRRFVEIEEGCGVNFVAGLGSAGDDSLIEWCEGQAPDNLFPLVDGPPDMGGQWTDEQFNSVSVAPFVPTADTSLLFYIQSFGECTDTSEVTVVVHPALTLTVSPDTTVEQGTEAFLFAEGAENFAWSPSENLSCQLCPDPTFLADTTTTFTVVASTDFGCADTAQVTVFVEIPEPPEPTDTTDFVFEMPNVFTPNGDGVNDVFNAVWEGDIFEEYKLCVYNRWGEQVFEHVDPDYGWDGTQYEEPAVSDVYVYHLVFLLKNGDMGERKGDVTLLR